MNRAARAGIIWCSILLLLQGLFAATVVVFLRQLGTGIAATAVLKSMLFQLIFITVSIGIYIWLRRRELKRSWVNLHLLLFYFIFLVLPLLQGFLPLLFMQFWTKQEVSVNWSIVYMLRQIVYYTCLCAGFLFLVLNIFYAIRDRAPVPDAGLLDEFEQTA
jgi:hypothetical protein